MSNASGHSTSEMMAIRNEPINPMSVEAIGDQSPTLTPHDSAVMSRMSLRLEVTVTVSRCTFKFGS